MHNRAPLILLSVFMFSVLFAPALVMAQAFNSNQAFDFIWVRTFGFDQEWASNPRLLLVNAVVPAFALFAIMVGMMRVVGVSRGMGSTAEYLIAIAVMLAALFTGGLGWISQALVIMGSTGVIIFVAMFMVGSGLWAWSYVRRKDTEKDIEQAYGRSVKSIRAEIRVATDGINRLRARAAAGEDINNLEGQIATLERRRNELMDQLANVRGTYRRGAAGGGEGAD